MLTAAFFFLSFTECCQRAGRISLCQRPVPVKIGDLTTIEGVRENSLIGYGMVVGLTLTGTASRRSLRPRPSPISCNAWARRYPPHSAQVKNVAAVFVTASLPPFARPGTAIDVTVSSVGDAKSLEGGLLLLTPLYGADGQVLPPRKGRSWSEVLQLVAPAQPSK